MLAFQDGVLTIEPHDVEDGIDTIPEQTHALTHAHLVDLHIERHAIR